MAISNLKHGFIIVTLLLIGSLVMFILLSIGTLVFTIVYSQQSNKNFIDPQIRTHTILDDTTYLNKKNIIVDLHTDALYFHVRGKKNLRMRSDYKAVDIPRLIEGSVNAQVFAIWPNPELLHIWRYSDFVFAAIDTFKQICLEESAKIALALSSDDVINIVNSGRIAGILAIEGGHALEGRVDMIDTFYNRGIRLLTITWNNSNELADAALDRIKPHHGLSDIGVKVIKRMNELGMIIDVSHASAKAIEDIIFISEAPIIASHSGIQTLRNFQRNLSDDQIKAIAQKGGVIGVCFWPPALCKNRLKASITHVLNTIDYIKKMAGIDYIAIGSDFDGLTGPPPKGLEDVTMLPSLRDSLINRGYSIEEVTKIFGHNFLRVWRKIEQIGNRLTFSNNVLIH